MNTAKKRRKRTVPIALTLSLVLFMSGCDGSLYSNYIQVEELQLVQTFGIDCTDSGVDVSISTGEGMEDQASVRISRPGKSIITAIQSIQDYSSKNELRFSHSRFAVIGEEGAKKKLPEFLDFLERSSEPRMDMSMFVVKEGTAKNLITQSGEKGNDVTESLSSIERDVMHSGESYPFTCREIARSLSEFGGALICAVSGNQTDGSIFSDSGTVTATPAGFGIISDGYLCGYLDQNEARAACMLLNKSGIGAIMFPDGNGGLATVFMNTAKTKYKGVWDESGELRQLRVDTILSVVLAELEAPINIIDEKVQKQLATELSNQIKKDCISVFEKSKSLDSDFLGLYGILRRSEPGKMYDIKDSFMDTLKNVELVVNVSTEISGSYDVERQVSVNGKGA